MIKNIRKLRKLGGLNLNAFQGKYSSDIKDTYETTSTGNGFDYKMYLQCKKKIISPWHDISPFSMDGTVNSLEHSDILKVVIEIPL